MSDYLLKYQTETEFNTSLVAAGLLQEHTDIDGTTYLHPTSGVTLDRIGPICKPEVLNKDDTVLTPASEDLAFHANLRLSFELTPEQEAMLSQVNPPPAIPYRVFC
jgi:hypothetical protein